VHLLQLEGGASRRPGTGRSGTDGTIAPSGTCVRALLAAQAGDRPTANLLAGILTAVAGFSMWYGLRFRKRGLD